METGNHDPKSDQRQLTEEPRRPSLLAITTGAWGRLPVTCALVFVASMYFSVASYLRITSGVDESRFRHPGSLARMELVHFPEVHGAFDLWEGEWWRLLANAFHHGGIWHLGMNCLSLWLLGGLLEHRMGAARYALFCLTAAVVSMIPEVMIERYAIGLSGVVFAQFGALLVMRNRDEELAARFTTGVIKWGFIFLFACIPLTLLAGFNIANGAHLAGIVYGAAIGWTGYELPRRRPGLALAGLVWMHAGLIVLLVALINPFWNGRHLVWTVIAHREEPSLKLWQQATDLEPTLAVAWESQAEILMERHDPQRAWEVTLRGLRFNRSNQRLVAMAHRIWQDGLEPGVERGLALLAMRKNFPSNELEAWKERLGLSTPSGLTGESIELAIDEFLDEELVGPHDLKRVLDVPAHVSGITRPHSPASPPADVDPNDPASALLGTPL